MRGTWMIRGGDLQRGGARAPWHAALAVACLCIAGPSYAGVTERVSVGADGAQGNKAAGCEASISADGRFVSFESDATNLVPGDTNGAGDIFVRDRTDGTTQRVSVASDGKQANGDSMSPAISADGRYVAFLSMATNLAPGDTNGYADIFVHDRVTGATDRVSVATYGAQANRGSAVPAISADGRFVAFESDATNLAPGDTNGTEDVFVRDRLTGTTERVSVDSHGAQSRGVSFRPTISADGRFVAFQSNATDLVPKGSKSPLGNGSAVFVHDRLTGATECVSVASDGTVGNAGSYWPSISGDGRYVAFWSDATNLVPGDTNGYEDVFVHDRQTGATERVSVAADGSQCNGHTTRGWISADGRYVAFGCGATNLASGGANGVDDVFVRDRLTGEIERVTVASDGTRADARSYGCAISADGRCVVFWSDATMLVPDDTNGERDIFVHVRTGVARAPDTPFPNRVMRLAAMAAP